MPMLNIDGQRVRVDDSFLSLSREEQESTVTEISSKLGKGAPSAERPPEQMFLEQRIADVAKSAGISLAEAGIGLSNIPELGARGIDYMVQQAGKKLGLGDLQRPGTQQPTFEQRFAGSRAAPEQQAAQQYEQNFPYPGPGIQQAIEQQTGPFYVPQTPEGRIAHDVAPFALGALGRAGGIGARLGAGVAAPYGAYKGAEALTEGTPYQKPAMLAAALLAPSVAGKIPGMRAGAAAPKTTTTAGELEASAGKTYNEAFDMPVNTEKLRKSTAAFEKDLYKQRRPQDTPEASGILNDIKASTVPSKPEFQMKGLESAGFTPPQIPQMTVGEMRTHRMRASELGADFTKSKSERAVAHQVVKFIDKEINAVSPALRTANLDYAQAARYRDVAKTRADALIDAETFNSGFNVGNKLRQRYAPDLRDPYGFKPNEIAQLEAINQGKGGVNALRTTGNLISASVPLIGKPIGLGFKALENRRVKAQVDQLMQTILSGAPSAKKAKQTSPAVRAALARLLLAGAASR